MKAIRVVMVLAGLVALMAPPPAQAYDIFLTQWNTSELEAAGDKVKVTISGNTLTFLWVSGDALPPTATNLKELFWSENVFTAGGGIGTGTGDYTGVTDCGSGKSGGCQADGFGKFRVKVSDSDAAKNKTTGPLTFTFANNLDLTNFTTADFVLHVQYTNNCSGFVGGSNDDPSSNTNCTPVPEPITMFLGGTGLVALGYAARKRLFGGQLAS